MIVIKQCITFSFLLFAVRVLHGWDQSPEGRGCMSGWLLLWLPREICGVTTHRPHVMVWKNGQSKQANHTKLYGYSLHVCSNIVKQIILQATFLHIGLRGDVKRRDCSSTRDYKITIRKKSYFCVFTYWLKRKSVIFSVSYFTTFYFFSGCVFTQTHSQQTKKSHLGKKIF